MESQSHLIWLTNRKQFIKYNNSNISFQKIISLVLQGSVVGPLLFCIYVNGLKNALKSLDSILFADATNNSRKNMKGLFYI